MTKQKISLKNGLKKSVKGCVILGLVGILAAGLGNWYVKRVSSKNIISVEAAEGLAELDCIMVLGCGLRVDGTPTKMLADRLDKGIELYQAGVAEKLLMSGDHGRLDYDEVNQMKQYAIDKGVPSEDIFMDHAGFSTYESMYRAKEIFQVSKMAVVTQNYHLNRAVYIGIRLGIDTYGVSAKQVRYGGQLMRDLREVLARNKDLVICMLRPSPTYLGEAIPVSGNGDITNDKEKE